MTVRVVFADDNYLVREGVAGLLTESAAVDLVETVADPESLLRAVATHRPDAVLTDIQMPPTLGAAASAIGLGLGVVVAKGLRMLMDVAGFSLPSTSPQLEPRTIWVSILVGTLVTVVA